ncbi:MAG: biotin--[acetyl-CoA-carboxylase] ligase [Prochlorococcaceae cyanobacterium]
MTPPAAIAAARRQLPVVSAGAGDGAPALCWRLQGRRVCASTERELEAWLAGGGPLPLPPPLPPPLPLAVIARRQRFGRGQQGRFWSSPPGGVWLSAALPWPEQPAGAASLALAAAVGLALELEALGLAVQLKWPNDLLLRGRKLAGLLPRLRLRGGRIRWAQVGVGLNGRNRVPAGAIAVAEVLGRRHPAAAPAALAARVLRGLEWAAAAAGQPELVRRQAERRLLASGSVQHAGQCWQVVGLGTDGSLSLRNGAECCNLQRSF